MINDMIATTQDQSERLLRCGVPADTADMHHDMCYDNCMLSIMDYVIPHKKEPDIN